MRLDVAAAETADRLRRQHHFAHRLQHELVALADRALRRDVEGADRFQCVAEEVEAQRLLAAGNVEVENAAAHGELADVAHRWHAFEATAFETCHEPVHVDLVARTCGKRLRLDRVRRRHLLQGCIDRHQHDRAMRRRSERDEIGHRTDPARRGIRAGRHSVVGQTVPAGQFERRQTRRDKGQRGHEARHALPVAHDVDQRPVCRCFLRDRGDRECLIALGDAVEDDCAAGVGFQPDGCRRFHGAVSPGSSAGTSGCGQTAAYRVPPAPPLPR